jgi:Icc-related predicted phosphoesterase
MKILAVSDMHGDLSVVKNLVVDLKPDLLLCCGDWGDPGKLGKADYQWIIDRTYVLTVFGNHDNIELLASLQNTDGSLVLLTNGEPRSVGTLRIAGINGIWAKSHRQPWYITDKEVVAAAKEIGLVDILVTHGCGVGLADTIPGGKRGGQRCFLDAFRLIRPKVYICGHLHNQQIRELKDGVIVLNVGYSAKGDFALIDVEDGQWHVNIDNLQHER